MKKKEVQQNAAQVRTGGKGAVHTPGKELADPVAEQRVKRGAKNATTATTSAFHAQPGESMPQTTDDSFSEGALVITNLKQKRFQDESRLKTLKWNFSAKPTPQHLNELNAHLATVCKPALHLLLVHTDYRKHLKAIEALQASIQLCPEALIDAGDLLLKWLSLRLIGSSHQIHVKALAFTQTLLQLFKDSGESLNAIEIDCFLPFLLQKAGEPNEVVRNGVRASLALIYDLSPASSIAPHLIDGIKTRNCRQKASCIEQIGQLIQMHDLASSSQLAPTLKAIAACVGDRDASVRNAALSSIGYAWQHTGDKIIKMIGRVSNADLTTVKKHIKRMEQSMHGGAGRSTIIKPPLEHKTTHGGANESIERDLTKYGDSTSHRGSVDQKLADSASALLRPSQADSDDDGERPPPTPASSAVASSVHSPPPDVQGVIEQLKNVRLSAAHRELVDLLISAHTSQKNELAHLHREMVFLDHERAVADERLQEQVDENGRLQHQISLMHHVATGDGVFAGSRVMADFYEPGNDLGEGAFGCVKAGFDTTTGELLAVKVISKWRSAADVVMSEVNVCLRCRGHENIVQLREWFEDRLNFYLVFEFLAGGNLAERIQRKVYFTEQEAAMVVKDLVSALQYLHSLGIVHRDLKAENVFMVRLDQSWPVKVGDYGLASAPPTTPTNGIELHSPVGTADHTAPEVIGCHYDHRADYWNLGVVLFHMLGGYLPFFADDCRHERASRIEEENAPCEECRQQLDARILHCEYDFPEEDWSGVSDDAKDLISSLLVDVAFRVSGNEILTHPWMINNCEPPPPVLNRMAVVSSRLSAITESLSDDDSSEASVKKGGSSSGQQQQRPSAHLGGLLESCQPAMDGRHSQADRDE